MTRFVGDLHFIILNVSGEYFILHSGLSTLDKIQKKGKAKGQDRQRTSAYKMKLVAGEAGMQELKPAIDGFESWLVYL